MECSERDTLRDAPGKLKAAVRHSLSGGIHDDTDEALAKFGLVREEPENSQEPFPVYASNWQTMTIFWATWNQWRMRVVDKQVMREGMDWAQVESALSLSGIKRAQWPLIFEGLRTAETVAIEYFNGDAI